MSSTLRTPVEGFCGEVAGVMFSNGIGTCPNDADLSYFERHGYAIEREKAPQAKTRQTKG